MMLKINSELQRLCVGLFYLLCNSHLLPPLPFILQQQFCTLPRYMLRVAQISVKIPGGAVFIDFNCRHKLTKHFISYKCSATYLHKNAISQSNGSKEMWFKWLWKWHGCCCQTGWCTGIFQHNHLWHLLRMHKEKISTEQCFFGGKCLVDIRH